jgi:CheY-like chemotaxis protein
MSHELRTPLNGVIGTIDPQCDRGDSPRTDHPSLAFRPFQGQSLRVLICEDAPVNQMFAKEVCRRAGIDCVIGDNGKVGVETLAQDSEFDVIFMDCHMPVMDGFEASRRIRQMTEQGLLPHIPIVALTANALADVREKCIEAGMDDYLAKPFEIDQFLNKIHTNTPASINLDYSAMEQPEISDPVFNIEKLLEQIGDRSFALDLARQFADSFSDYQDDLEKSVSLQDSEQAFQVAHRIKGVAGMVHANRIKGVAKKIESTVRDGQLELLQTQVEEILQEFESFENAYREECATADCP